MLITGAFILVILLDASPLDRGICVPVWIGCDSDAGVQLVDARIQVIGNWLALDLCFPQLFFVVPRTL